MKYLFFLVFSVFISSTSFAQKQIVDTVLYPVVGKTQIKSVQYGEISIITIEQWVYNKFSIEVMYANSGLSSRIQYPCLALVVDKEYINLMTRNGMAMMKRHYKKSDNYVKPNEIPETSIDW
jgi:hypothetical protein